MNNIMPMRDLSTKTSQIVQMCYETGEPVFITKNGYGSLVVMSMESYQKQFLYNSVRKKVSVALAQVESGEVVSGEEVMKEMRAKYCEKI